MKVNFTKKLLSCILTFVFALNILGTQIPVFADTNSASTAQITIFHTNDMHGRLLDAYDSSSALTQIGSDYVAAIKKSVPNSLLIDAGDATQGLPFATLSKGADVIKLMNAAGYDGMVLGNHEFDYGKDQTLANAKLANFPVISANTVFNGQPFLNGINGNNGADFIKTVNGIKVGFFGITTQETVYKTNPSNLQGVSFQDPITTSQAEVNKLKGQGATVIIGIMHIGDDQSSSPTSEDIAKSVSGINVIIDGHSHTIENKIANGTLIAQTLCNSANLGRLDITVGTNGSISSTETLVKAAAATSYTPDPDVKALAAQVSSSQASLFATVVGATNSSLWGGTVNGQSIGRLGETNLGDLVADAMAYSAKSQVKGTAFEGLPVVSLENGGGVRDTIPKGIITQGQVTTVLPFGNILSLKEVTPDILYKALENGVSKITGQNQTTGAISGASGCFPQISGMRFEYNPQNPASGRVNKIVLLNSDGSDKQVLDKNDTTTKIVLASNDYEIGGGDGYTMLKDLKNIGESNALDVITSQYITKLSQQAGGSFSYPPSQGRIKAVSNYTYTPYSAAITVKNGTSPAANANLQYSIDNGTSVAAATDSNGVLSIVNIPSGPHTVSITSNGTYTDVFINDITGATTSAIVTATLKAYSSISVLATSDIHGNVLNYDYASGTTPAHSQGLAKVSSYVNSVRAANPNVMLVDDGDTIQGTPLSYYYDMLDTTSEYPLMKVMGAMKYDTWTLGNHEFNYGLATLNRVISDAQKEGINVLSANTYKNDNTNFVSPYYIKSFNVNGKTIKVGILGLTTKCIPNWEDKAHYDGLHFNDLVDEAKLWVPKVKAAGADVVIVAAHSGEESASDTIPENQVKALATNVSGIDAIIAGHVHNVVNDTSLKNPDGKTVPVLEPGKWGNYVSQINVNLDVNGTVTGISANNVSMDNTVYAEDPSIVSLIQPYQAPTLKYIQTKLGTSTGEFKGDGQTTQATPIMELINKVQKDASGAQISIAAPLSSSAYIPSGDITIKDIMSVYVYENFLYGVKMTGKQLKNWMEYSVRYYKQAANSTDAIVKDPTLNIPDYNLDQLYGATYDIDLTEPACTVDKTTGQVTSGNRIKNLKMNGVLVKDTDVFNVAINNYRYNGGGGFMKAAGLSSTDPSIVTYDSAKALGDDGQVRSLMNSYIKKYQTISPDCSNNWKLYTTAVTPETSVTPVTPTPVVPASTAPASVSNSNPASVLSAVQTAIANNTAVPTVDVSSSPVVSKDVFNAIKGQNKTITFTGNNITWTFNGKDITSTVTSDIDLSLKTVSSDLQAKELAKIKAVTGKDANVFCFSFNYEGTLPGTATVKIFMGKSWANKTVNVCRYYSDKNTYEIVQNNLKVDADGYLTYTTNHCSDYFVTDNSQITNLPQTGSAIDYNFVIDLGALCAIIGIALFIAGKKRNDDDDLAA